MTSARRGVAIGALAAALAGGLVASGLVVWRLSRSHADGVDPIAALQARLDRGGSTPAEDHHRLGLKLAGEGDPEGLAHLELAAAKEPSSLEYGNDVRAWAVRTRQYDRSIRFFEALVRRTGQMPEPRLELALAYVDKMPEHMMGIVGQGRLSKMSIAELTRILDRAGPDARPITLWAATYALGKNHLYWPKMMRHAPAAEAAFRSCLQMNPPSAEGSPQANAREERAAASVAAAGRPGSTGATPSGDASPRRGLESSPSSLPAPAATDLPPYYALAYEGLGDALVKEGRHAEARAAWREGLARFPGDADLQARLAIADDDALTTFIDTTRGLGVVVDTDLSVFWRENPSLSSVSSRH